MKFQVLKNMSSKGEMIVA